MKNACWLAAMVLVSATSFSPALAQDCEGVAPVSHTALKTVEIATGLSSPVYVAQPPGEIDRLFIVEQQGKIWIHERGTPPTQLIEFLDITTDTVSGGEQGLLSMAFDPNFATSGYFYVNYTRTGLGGGAPTAISRFSVSTGNPNAADPSSELRILDIGQPEVNHNGGLILFGDDGYLYIFTGDGGGGGDAHGVCGNGQNTASMLGKVLRLDVNGVDPNSTSPDCGSTSNYTVPLSNPFHDGSGGVCDEIFMTGLRNPWRSDIDPVNGDFYIGDVGEVCWEEVNFVPGTSAGGQNFGWRQMEGAHCFDGSSGSCDPAPLACSGSPACNDASLTLPISEYAHGGGCTSVTGGVVYRGCLMPNLTRTYFYGDYCGGWVRTFVESGGVATNPQDITSGLVAPSDRLRNELSSFARGTRGEVFITDMSGEVLKILPVFTDMVVSGPGAGNPFLLGTTKWTWEDLQYETEHPVDFYRVYRGLPNDIFNCIHATPFNEWDPGDSAEPAPGQMFAYLVTASSSDGFGGQTSPGEPEASRTLSGGGCS